MNKTRTHFQALYGVEPANQTGTTTGFKLSAGIRAAAGISLPLALVMELAVIHFFTEFVKMQQDIFVQGSLVEVECQRRGNLIPRLAELSGNYARHERELMNYISDARVLKKYSEKMKGRIGPDKSAQLDKVFSKLLALAEQYPELQTGRSYQALMAKNVATENRVAAAREKYISLIDKYNSMVQTFPYALFARFLKFHKISVYVPEKQAAPEKARRFFFLY